MRHDDALSIDWYQFLYEIVERTALFTPRIRVARYNEAVSAVSGMTAGEVMSIDFKLCGQVMMELGEYPFSKKFGFLADKYGVAWQLNLAGEKQRILPSLIFVNQSFGKAESAMHAG